MATGGKEAGACHSAIGLAPMLAKLGGIPEAQQEVKEGERKRRHGTALTLGPLSVEAMEAVKSKRCRYCTPNHDLLYRKQILHVRWILL